MNMSLSDLGAAADLAQKIDPDPIGLFWRLLGMGADERAAGIPAWSWAVLVFGAGLAAGVKYGPVIESVRARAFEGTHPRRVE